MDISAERGDNWIWYCVLFPGSDWGAGNARVEFNPLRHYRDPRNRIYGRLIDAEGLEQDHVIAQITYFYPHYNHETSTSHMRLGVGTNILERLRKDSVKRGARTIYARGPSESMRSFLVNKHGFSQCDPALTLDKESEFYKILGREQQGSGL